MSDGVRSTSHLIQATALVSSVFVAFVLCECCPQTEVSLFSWSWFIVGLPWPLIKQITI